MLCPAFSSLIDAESFQPRPFADAHDQAGSPSLPTENGILSSTKDPSNLEYLKEAQLISILIFFVYRITIKRAEY